MENWSLWINFLDGDDSAYAALYKKHIDSLFAYGMCFTPNRELVKDCVHDVFVKIYQNRKHLHPVDNVKVYLFISLKNSLFDSFGNEKSFGRVTLSTPCR
jgi:DNA-directed RNA polymerase specialized sigma24 family protein